MVMKMEMREGMLKRKFSMKTSTLRAQATMELMLLKREREGFFYRKFCLDVHSKT